MKKFALGLQSLLAIGALAVGVCFAQQRPTFSTTTSVVVVNVTVLDRNGKPIENLTKNDFQVFEDGKLQKLQSMDLQRLDTATLPTPAETPQPVEPKGYNPDVEKVARESSKASPFQDRRLIVMLFDFSSMEAAEQMRAKDAALKFINTQMTASDTIAIQTFGSQLTMVQDFTSNRDVLVAAIQRFRAGDSSENAGTADTGADSQDQSGTFVADETEFNIFNSDIKLASLEDAARKLAPYPEKKALIYFSSGIQKTGVDNQSQLRATINTAVRANVSFYPIDARGLTAVIPGGDATQSGAVGNNLYSGAGQRAGKDNFNNQQETLSSLATDTGGKALLDSNDLTEGMRQVQKDFTSYYVLTYASSNPTEDGRYRRIQVKLNPTVASLKPKIEYRLGYYAPTTFARMREVDKESQLSQALATDNPVTDLPIAVEADYFRMDRQKYFVPISVKIPGSALAFKAKGSKQATELDFIAQVFDAKGRSAATVRDTIPLKLNEATAGEVGHKNIQYDTGVTLTPGKYRLRFVARENGEGKIGTFESQVMVPDLGSGEAMRVSSLIVSNQREAVSAQIGGAKLAKKVLAENPLMDDQGRKLLPNVTRVFRPNQNLIAYLEVYDPTIPSSLPENFKIADVSATLAFYQEDRKVFETKPISARRLDTRRTNMLPVWMQVPLTTMKPGKYTCQMTVIDGFGRKFAFPRTPVAVLAE